MKNHLQTAGDLIQKKFNGELSSFRDHITLLIKNEFILEACQILRDDFSFEVLVDETVVDYWRRKEPRFQVVYKDTQKL